MIRNIVLFFLQFKYHIAIHLDIVYFFKFLRIEFPKFFDTAIYVSDRHPCFNILGIYIQGITFQNFLIDLFFRPKIIFGQNLLYFFASASILLNVLIINYLYQRTLLYLLFLRIRWFARIIYLLYLYLLLFAISVLFEQFNENEFVKNED